MKRLRIRVIGDVQGVFYRYNAKMEADKLRITGWIINEPDGSVTTVIEGEDDMTQKFVEWCRVGSPMAEIEEVQVDEESHKGEFYKFEIK